MLFVNQALIIQKKQCEVEKVKRLKVHLSGGVCHKENLREYNQ